MKNLTSLVSKTALIGVAMLVCGSAAQAQAPATGITPPPAVAPAPQAELAPSHLAAGIEVVEVSGFSRSLNILVPQMVDRAKSVFIKMRPEIAGEIEKSSKALEPEWESQRKIILDIAGKAFAHKLSETELKDIAVFFKSGAGQKFVNAQPAVLDEMFRGVDDFTPALSKFVLEKLRDDLKKKNIDF